MIKVLIFIFFCLFLAAKGPPVQRAPLKHRDYHVDLESRLGKTQVSFISLS